MADDKFNAVLTEYLNELAWFRLKARGAFPTPDAINEEVKKMKTAIGLLAEQER